MKIIKCPYCIYITDVKCNMFRHINAKHITEIDSFLPFYKGGQNVPPNEQNVPPTEQNVPPNEQNVRNDLLCMKCNKIYKTKKHLQNHEMKCKGIDCLTCPKCMISFTSRKHKSRHIKANKCKARSIIHAREPNPHNIINTQNNIQNNIQNQNNNIIINNFGSERIDHITDDDIIKMLMAGMNTLPMYIEKKHFDKNFPENNNIVYTKENKCKVLEKNAWKERDIGLLSSKLIKDNSQVLLLYCDKNEVKIEENISDSEIYDRIKNKLAIIYNKSDNEKYNHIISIVKELVKNSNF